MAPFPHQGTSVMLLLSSITCCACTVFPGGGPIEEYYERGADVLNGPTCKVSRGKAFLDIPNEGSRGSCPRRVQYRRAGLSVFQRLLFFNADYEIIQLRLLNYSGVHSSYSCGDDRRPLSRRNKYTIRLGKPIVGMNTYLRGKRGLDYQPHVPHVYDEGSVIPPVICAPRHGAPRRNSTTLTIHYDD
eukprot:scpid104052/ scgid23697/ 